MQISNNFDADAITGIVIRSFQNAIRINAEKIKKIDPDTKLIGNGAVMDSVAFVGFVVDLESYLAESTGVEILLTEDPEAFNSDGPFRTIAALVASIQERLDSNK